MRTQNIKNKKPSIYLIGISHEAQFKKDLPLKSVFRNYLEKTIKIIKPDLIAEEFSEEALQINKVNNTIAQKVAEQNSILHIFCDPDSEVRKKIGYPSRMDIKKQLGIKKAVFEDSPEDKQIKEEMKKYNYIREQFWLNEILRFPSKTILFICGSDHLKTFHALVFRKGFIPVIFPS